MGHKIALAASAAVAAFVIVLLGAVGTYVLLKSPQANAGLAAPASGQVTNQQAQLPLSPDGFGQSSANSSSGATNNDTNGNNGADGSSGQANGSAADPAGYAVSADQAAAIALNSAPGSTLQQPPRLVQINGQVAYQVTLDRGDVAVDANTGQILYSQATGRLRHRRAP